MLRWQPVSLFALGIALGVQGERADACSECSLETECTFKKPNILIVLEYSSAMNEEWMGETRWDTALALIDGIFTTQNGYLDDQFHFALLRYGHDPDPANAGTLIVGDSSGLVDGTALDVLWYDPASGPDFPYLECNGAAVSEALAALDPPLCLGNPCTGISSWTAGALERAGDIVVQSRLDHPDDLQPFNERFYANVLVTSGAWTDPDGTGMDPAQDPTLVAAELLADEVWTYVYELGDGAGDAIAMAGGTGEAMGLGPQQLYNALAQIIDDILAGIIIPECTAGLPRLMVLLDASSAMLNVPDGMGQPVAGAMGETAWDQARALVVPGASSLFDSPVPSVVDQPLENMTHVGVIVFGDVGDERLLLQYGGCSSDNLAWALDPSTSCGAGCNDPWGGPPIAWTFVGPGAAAYPGLDLDTYSHMPACDDGVVAGACSGSDAYLHLGLELAHANKIAYATEPPPISPADSSTTYVNLLVTTGAYSSTDAQVEAALTAMVQDGITTYVLGLGDPLPQPQLDNLACWGSGGTGLPCAGGTIAPFDAGSLAALEQALVDIPGQLDFDPCCTYVDCSFTPEPSTGEPDPVPDPEPCESSSSTTDVSTTIASSEAGDPVTGADTMGVDEGTSTTASGESTGDDAGPTTATTSSTTTTGTTSTSATSAATTVSTSTDDDDSGTSDGESLSRDSCSCREQPPRPSAWLIAVAFIARRRRR